MPTESTFTVVFKYATDEMPREGRFDHKADAELFWTVLTPLFAQGKITRARLWVQGGPCLQEMGT
jgi:hypothetical protein